MYVPLREATEVAQVGGKGEMLGRLLRSKVHIPDGIVFTTEMLVRFLADHGLDVADGQTPTPEMIGKIRHALKHAVWQPHQLEWLREVYDAMPGRMCVRSSAVLEDGQHSSYAGVFTSVLNVTTFGEFIRAVREVWESAYGPDAVAYAQQRKHPLLPMAVVVQQFLDATASGVAFLTEGRLHISATYGLGVGVVSGRVPADSYTLSHRGAEPELEIHAKGICYVANESAVTMLHKQMTIKHQQSEIDLYPYDTDDRNAVYLCQVLPQRHAQPANSPVLKRDNVLRLAETLYALQDGPLGSGDWDIEWCWHHDEPRVLQARPLTSSKVVEAYDAEPEPSSAGRLILTGKPISAGEGIGPVRNINKDEDLDRIEAGDILVMDWIPDHFIRILTKAAALLISDGSPLSHCAIIAREWNIPCVGGVQRGSLQDGVWYRVNGSTGKVYEAVDRPSVHQPSGLPAPTERLYVHAWLIQAMEAVNASPASEKRWMNKWRKLLQAAGPDCEIVTDGVEELLLPGDPLAPLFDRLLAGALRDCRPAGLIRGRA
ncbi:PEP/pyruvate-binding domain-containing protein [Paenibacillus sp. 598K]|uniref:PEP/pyruvate-binding domain-containing protein n=1 Tax=Paenibacillus sp. 598K TaxID=1117987 RepID=UPI0021AA610D|nr:PEP/pyruvate-binding domain-containing protein [Paenibacillus sp. 598K]